MPAIKYILLDAANTIIHKPQLWEKVSLALQRFGYYIPEELLKRNHKLLSESIRFPDRTSKDFYQNFNAELLYSLGIIPQEAILSDIFSSCTYLPWEKFPDTDILRSLSLPIGILSNFNSSLPKTLESMFGSIFRHYIVSENYGFGKPDERFYEQAVNEIGLPAENILYIGDSIKLDMEPAIKTGLSPILIDRDNTYPFYPARFNSLAQIVDILS